MNHELEVRHMAEKNRLAKYAGTIVAALVFIFTALACVGQGTNTLFVVRMAIAVIDIIVLQVMAKIMGGKYEYKFVITLSMATLFVLTVFYPSDKHLYPLMYFIIIIVLIYGEASTVRIGCIVAIVSLALSNIIEIRRGNNTVNELATEVGLAVFACVIAVLYCKQQRRQNDETMTAIKEGVSAQEKTSSDIIDLAEQLNEKFTEARGVSDKLNESMEATHSSVMEIVEGTKNTAEAIEAQTNRTAEIQESIQNVGEEATTIQEVSGNVEASVAEGVELINQLKDQAVKVANINIETKNTTQALNESIQDVQAITETILGISSQTNLLALNASIEAARAGEAGKGFAVVADEIRALSESTREATEEISRIIERLTEDAKSAAAAMEKSADYANRQNELITDTGAKLDAIKDGADELHEGVLQIKGSVQDVINANQHIMDNITNLSATSEEVAASTDTVLAVSDAAMDALDGMNGALEVIDNIAKNMEEVAEK